ncbi:DUF1016 family protein [Kaistella haifensis]|nr:DUF1016 family protein [Kaistella haifensis]
MPRRTKNFLLGRLSEKYSPRNLERQINASLYERTQVGDEKLSAVMRELEPSTKQIFRNSYVLEFLGLTEEHTKNDLQKELVKQIKKFIIELERVRNCTFFVFGYKFLNCSYVIPTSPYKH